MKPVALAAFALLALTLGPSILQRVEALEGKVMTAETTLKIYETRIGALDGRIKLLEMAEKTRPESNPDEFAKSMDLYRLRNAINDLKSEWDRSKNLTNEGRLCGGEIASLLRDRTARHFEFAMNRPVMFGCTEVGVQFHDLENGYGSWWVMGVVQERGSSKRTPMILRFAKIRTSVEDHRKPLATMEVEEVRFGEEIIFQR